MKRHFHGTHQMRILYVENHPRFARITIQIFLSVHQVTVAPSLNAARHELAQSTFEVLLLDYDLDDGKGVELLPELRNMPQRPLVIATSAHKVGNETLLAAGADGICSKMQFSQIEDVFTALAEQLKDNSSR